MSAAACSAAAPDADFAGAKAAAGDLASTEAAADFAAAKAAADSAATRAPTDFAAAKAAADFAATRAPADSAAAKAAADFAAAQWSRATGAGLDPHEYQRVTGALESVADWGPAFDRAGREHLRRAADEGSPLSAGERLLTAARWFHVATLAPFAGGPQLRRTTRSAGRSPSSSPMPGACAARSSPAGCAALRTRQGP
ncbi:hypothetical protein [Streptomyces alboflavus]|uniref:hypothetical protein n=1 Tax=Streptomyces alboflavus TaxID=67267 RepID=UPI0036CB0359